MKLVPALALLVLAASPALAEEPTPGSVLVFPARHGDAPRITLISVTNTSLSKSVRALYRYMESGPELKSTDYGQDCNSLYRSEMLTPADTVTVSSLCHAGANQGYLVVSAQDAFLGPAVAHDYLVGSALVVEFGGGFGGIYAYQPAAYDAIGAEGTPTDVDFDGRLDFDGIEYEQLPDTLAIDGFLGLGGSRLSLVNMTEDRSAVVNVQLYIWNDNEKPLSAQFSFRCWFEQRLDVISAAFSEAFLAANFNDGDEVDLDCDGFDDIESGWATVSGLTANGNFQTTANPPLLGALTGAKSSLEGGRLLWGSKARSDGSF